jgi:bacterioferritin (cytochrome b1)
VKVRELATAIRRLHNNDPTSCKVMEDILKTEEDHAKGMKSLPERMG